MVLEWMRMAMLFVSLHKLLQTTFFFLLMITLAISGGIYEDYPSFHPRVCKTIKDLIPEQIAGRLSVGVVKHSRIVGAAIVAMMAEKIAATQNHS